MTDSERIGELVQRCEGVQRTAACGRPELPAVEPHAVRVRPGPPADVDALIARYGAGSPKQQRDLLILLSIHPVSFSDNAWSWIEGFARDQSRDLHGVAFKTLTGCNSKRFGRSLALDGCCRRGFRSPRDRNLAPAVVIRFRCRDRRLSLRQIMVPEPLAIRAVESLGEGQAVFGRLNRARRVAVRAGRTNEVRVVPHRGHDRTTLSARAVSFCTLHC